MNEALVTSGDAALKPEPKWFSAATVIRLRIWIILLCLAVSLGTGYGLEKLQFSSDYRDFFETDNVKLQAFESLQNKFVRTNNVFIGVTRNGGELFDEPGLNLLADLTDRLWTLPHVIRVDSVTNYQFIDADNDEIQVADYVQDRDENRVDKKYLAKFYERATKEKGLNGYLVGPQKSIAGINVSLADSVTTEIEKAKFMQALDQLLFEFGNPSLQFHKTGSIVIDHGFDVSAQADVENLYGLVYLCVLVLTLLLTRSFVAMVAVLLTVTMSWFVALGIAGWLGYKLTAISVSAPTVLMTLAVAQSMHILFSVQRRKAQGLESKEATRQAIQSNIWPLFLVTLSTTVGFLGIMGSEVPPLQDLGFMLAVGNVAVFLFSITFLPAFLSFFSLARVQHAQRAEHRMGKLGEHIAKHSQIYLLLCGLSALLMIYPITFNELNDNFVEYFDEENQVRSDAEYINSNLTGVHQVYFELESSGSGGIFEPEYLDYVEKLSNWLVNQEEVRHVTSITNVQKKLYQASTGGGAAQYQLPESRESASQLHLLYEMSLPYGLSTNNIVDIKQKSSRLSIVVDNLSSKEILALEEKIREWHQAQKTEVVLHPGTGPTIMFADIGQRNASSLVVSTIQAFFFVFIVLVVALRSLKFSLLSLIPNLLPAVIAFGLWGLIDGEVGLAISIVVVMTFGIVVDDTIYLLTHIRKNLNRPTFLECIRETYSQVGSPIFNTTIILTCGFAILAFSSFRLNQGMGMLTAMVILIALVTDIFMLPGLVKRFIYKTEGQ